MKGLRNVTSVTMTLLTLKFLILRKMSLSRILPKPSLSTYDPDVQQQYRKQQEQKQAQNSGTLVKSGPPPYGNRKGWVPRYVNHDVNMGA